MTTLTTPNAVANELGFPHPTLTTIALSAQPSPKEIRQLKREVYSNARSVDSPQGGGNHGHLGLVMPAADYTALAGVGVAWAAPAAPVRPVIAPGTTNVMMNNQMNEWEEAKTVHAVFLKTSKTLKALVLEAVPVAYIESLADAIHGFNDVNVAAIIAHLETTYGAITTEDLEENEALLSAPWDPKDPTELIFNNADKILAFAQAGGEAIPDGKCVRTLVKVFEHSGVLNDAVKDWRKKTAVNQTYDNLRTHMRTYNQRRIRALTADEAGFNTANAATTQPSGDRETIAAAVQEVLRRQNSANQANGNNNAPTPDGPMFYCWSHGLGRDPNHTSRSCNNQAEGHQVDATVDNMMGGNNQVRCRRGERPSQHWRKQRIGKRAA